MANKVINSRVVMKHDTSANWALATNFIPLAGEIIVYSDLNKFKIGDGTTLVGNLPFSEADLKDFVGATAQVAGEHGLVPAPAAGDQGKYLKGDGTWGVVDALPSQSGQSGKYLTTDGSAASWATVELPADMTGATATTAGVHGLVPAPAAGQQERFLKGDGTWGRLTKVLMYSNTIIGDGETTDFVINHDLNTRNLLAQVTNTTTFETVVVDVTRTSVNSVTIGFFEAPAADVTFNVLLTGYLETDVVPSEFVVDSIQGDGTTTLFTVTHNFNTRNVLVQVTDAVNFANVIVEVYRPTVNTIQVEFAEAPAANEMFNVMCFKCQDVHALQDANWEAF